MDNDSVVLKVASEAMTAIDLQHRAATFPDKLVLGPERDRAFSAYLAARLKLLADGVICTPADVAEMGKIRDEVNAAAERQTMLVAIGRMAGFLLKLVV